MRRVILAICVSIVLMTTSIVPSAATGDVQATVACSNGIESTEFTVVVDPPTLIDLKQAIEAMTLYPAGLSCTLVELPLVGWFSGVALADSGAKDFAVMGGQISSLQPGCTGEVITIAISAHVDTGQTTAGVGGTVNQNAQGKLNPLCEGHFKMSVHCVNVIGDTGYMTGRVEESSGQYATPLPPGSQLEFWVRDNTPDAVDALFPAVSLTACPSQAPPTNSLVRGNVLVRDRTP